MLSFSPQDVLDEIWALIDSVSKGFPTYFLDDCPNIKLSIWLAGDGHLSVSSPIGVKLMVFCCVQLSVVIRPVPEVFLLL